MKHNRLTALSSALILALSGSACASHGHHGRAAHVRANKNVKIVKVLPAGHTTLQLGGVSYYRFGGVYYRPYRGAFQIVTAPVGLSVTTLPNKHRLVRVNKQRYFVAEGVYYRKSGKRYIVVKKPV